MNRRSLLSLIASLPIVGASVKSSDGVALRSTSHPIGPSLNDLELNPDCLVTTEISLTRYAAAGELVTCENGHPICEFVVDVVVGQMQDLPNQLGKWRQQVPVVGQQIPVCAVCSAGFYYGSGVFHFKDGWRTYNAPSLFKPQPRQ